MRDNLPHALAYAARGWRVVPLHTPNGDRCDCARPDCGSVGKHPRIKDWTHTASCDEATVREWWGRWAHANVGIATGPESGIVVLDVDPRHGGYESLTKLTDEHGLMPHTVISNTGGGGWHFYLKHPGRKVLSHTILPGLDVKGDGGMVVAPASAHATGILYEWCDDCGPDEPLADIPAWLDALMAQASPAGLQRPPVTDVLASGDRNQGLFRLGSGMRAKGFSEPAIYAALLAENNERCIPPLAQTEVAVIAASASKYEPSEGIPIIGTGQAPASKPDGRRHVEPTTISLRELQGKVLPPRKMVVPGLCTVGLGTVAGRVKTGKSWLMLGLGLAIAEGGLALGEIPVEDGDVLYIAYEDDETRIQGRCQTLLGTDSQWPERFEVAPQGCWPRRGDGGLEAIDAWLGRHPDSRLVVLDTLQRFRGAEPGENEKNAYVADYEASAAVQELALKHGVAIIAIHHFRKSVGEDDWLDQFSGSIGNVAASDFLLGFFRMRGEMEATLRATGRDIREPEYALAFDPTKYGWVITGTADEKQMTDDAHDFCEAMQELGRGAAVHYNKIAEVIGKKRNTVWRMGQRLAERGVVIALGNGMFQPAGEEALSKLSKSPILNLKTLDNAPVQGLSKAVQGSSSPAAGFMRLDSLDNLGQPPLSIDFESENGDLDSLDSKSKNPVDRWLGGKSISRDGGGPCGVCGEHNWIPRATGGYVCDTCKPWIRSTTNDEEVGAG